MTKKSTRKHAGKRRVIHRKQPKTVVQRLVANLDGPRAYMPRTKRKRGTVKAHRAGEEPTPQSREALYALLDPFEAFADGIRPGCHIDAVGRATYKFATIQSTSLTSVLETAGSAYHVHFVVRPIPYQQLYIATAFSTTGGGTDTGFTAANDPFYSNMGTSYQVLRVVYQAVRVRNTTAIATMGGESCIGRLTAEESTSTSYNAFRGSSTRYVHSESDPGSVLQMTWEGVPDAARIDGTATKAVDYSFVDPGASIDAAATTMTYFSSSPASHTVDVEIVTFYEAVPFATAQFVFCPTRSEIDPTWVERGRDDAYARAPLYTVGRSVIKDDGVAEVIVKDAQEVWGGVKAGVRLFKNVASVVSSAWSSLFGARRESFMLRLVELLPPEHYSEIVNELAEFKDHATARASYLPKPRQEMTDEQIAMLLDLWKRTTISEPPSPTPSTYRTLRESQLVTVKR